MSGASIRIWLAGDEYSMADIITFPWIRTTTKSGARFAERPSIDLDDCPAVKRWHDKIAARPAVQRGLAGRPSNGAIGRSVRPSEKTYSAQPNLPPV